eukprot:1161325-Pelagomonas_calceolata.AAC.4
MEGESPLPRATHKPPSREHTSQLDICCVFEVQMQHGTFLHTRRIQLWYLAVRPAPKCPSPKGKGKTMPSRLDH